MSTIHTARNEQPGEYTEEVDEVVFRFDLSPTRRDFLSLLGATGLLIAVTTTARAQETGETGAARGRGGSRGRGRGAGGARTVAARVHLAPDGRITVLTGKVEGGQGARTELTQAAAEALRVGAGALTLLMCDTAQTPNDGGTYGSQSTPNTVPAVRRGCAAARELLIAFAARQWNVDPKSLAVSDGKITGPAGKSLGYADLAGADPKSLDIPIPQEAALTPDADWQTMGKPLARPNARDIVTGGHQYPSDLKRPGMLYGKVLRPPTYGARLSSVDPAAAKAMKGVIVVQDTDFCGTVAPTSFAAQAAVDALAPTAKWDPGTAQPASSELFDYLRKNARGDTANRLDTAGAARHLRATYHVPYIQHAPLEPRAAVAEWDGPDRVTVWTASQNPFNVRGELARAFAIPEENARVIIPDFGGAFGGKHSGECAVEAARLARTAGKPVHLRWTRREEFTWAYFRPAGVIDLEATLDEHDQLATWHHLNINSGPQQLAPPYDVAQKDCRFVPSKPPLRHGSYRALATTANTFARESFMDELARLAGKDPVDFRLAHLTANDRLHAALTEAARRFDWTTRAKSPAKNTGVGVACGTDKGSVVACCAEVAVDPADRSYKVTRITQVFEAGKIVNPQNLANQVKGAVVMGLGAALREQMRFENGRMLNASFGEYRVPRFEDVPFANLDVYLLDRPDIPSAGAGETPITAIAPAVANALAAATGARLRALPLKLTDADPAKT